MAKTYQREALQEMNGFIDKDLKDESLQQTTDGRLGLLNIVYVYLGYILGNSEESEVKEEYDKRKERIEQELIRQHLRLAYMRDEWAKSELKSSIDRCFKRMTEIETKRGSLGVQVDLTEDEGSAHVEY